MKKLFYLIGIVLFLLSVQFSNAFEENVDVKALLTTPPNYIGKCPKTIKFTGSTITVETTYIMSRTIPAKLNYRVILKDRYVLQDPANDHLGPFRLVTFSGPGVKTLLPEFKFRKDYKGTAILAVWDEVGHILANSAPVGLDIKCK